jgi:hypothetical protein
MLVSFYAQIFIISTSLLIVFLPFLGFPQSWNNALTAILGFLVFGTGIHALYGGYVRILKREERRIRNREAKKLQFAEETEEDGEEKEEKQFVTRESAKKDQKTHSHNVLQIIRD